MFAKHTKSKSGRASHCKACKSTAAKHSPKTKVSAKAWYEANKDKTLSAAKQDRIDNPEKNRGKEAAKYKRHSAKIKARVLAYQKSEPEVYRRAGKRYRETHPHLCCAKSAKRRAIKLQATPCWADDELEQLYLVEVYHLAQLRSDLGTEHHVDHIVPLISDKVCGLHCMANLRVLPALENISKGNRHWPDMP